MLRAAAIAFLLSIGHALAEVPAFRNEPIACGASLPWSKCSASFDGWTLLVHYAAADGRKMEAAYRTCVAYPDMIRCSAGEWRTGSFKGALEPRVIGLRNGKPFAD
jgi:hypothetical protein